jgi:hypothetical protein
MVAVGSVAGEEAEGRGASVGAGANPALEVKSGDRMPGGAAGREEAPLDPGLDCVRSFPIPHVIAPASIAVMPATVAIKPARDRLSAARRRDTGFVVISIKSTGCRCVRA